MSLGFCPRARVHLCVKKSLTIGSHQFCICDVIKQLVIVKPYWQNCLFLGKNRLVIEFQDKFIALKLKPSANRIKFHVGRFVNEGNFPNCWRMSNLTQRKGKKIWTRFFTTNGKRDNNLCCIFRKFVNVIFRNCF